MFTIPHNVMRVSVANLILYLDYQVFHNDCTSHNSFCYAVFFRGSSFQASYQASLRLCPQARSSCKPPFAFSSVYWIDTFKA